MPKSRVVGHDLDKIYTDEWDFQLGAEVEDEQGRVYVFIRYQDLSSADGEAGLMVVSCDTDYAHYDATCDSDNAEAVESVPFGQLQAALTDGDMGFAQKRGYNRLAGTTGGSVAHSDELAVSGAARGTLLTKVSHQGSVGAALEADTGTVLAAGEIYFNIA